MNRTSLGPTLSFQTYTIRQLDLMSKSFGMSYRYSVIDGLLYFPMPMRYEYWTRHDTILQIDLRIMITQCISNVVVFTFNCLRVRLPWLVKLRKVID